MTLDDIRAAIDGDSALRALAPDTAAIAAALSVGRRRIDGAAKFTSLGIAEHYPEVGGLPGPLAAELALQKIEGFATAAIQGSDPAGRLLGGAIVRQTQHLSGGRHGAGLASHRRHA